MKAKLENSSVHSRRQSSHLPPGDGCHPLVGVGSRLHRHCIHFLSPFQLSIHSTGGNTQECPLELIDPRGCVFITAVIMQVSV